MDYAVCWDCLFFILKHRYYRKAYSLKTVLNTHHYQVNTPLAIIRYDGSEEDFAVGYTTADNCLTTHKKCFDESAEHKTILSNFCLECKSVICDC